jgi:hypothetical protein
MVMDRKISTKNKLDCPVAWQAFLYCDKRIVQGDSRISSTLSLPISQQWLKEEQFAS